MALNYGFYNSSGGDRRYNAEQVSSIFNFLITEGVLSSVGEHFGVIPGQGRQVLVKSGWAWFDSTWTHNDSSMPLNLEAPDISVNRIDAVVIETNKNLDVRANTIKVVTGSPSSSPQKPAMTNTSAIGQHPIAYVTVRAGMTSVGLSDIEIVVGKDECPFITSILQSTSISVLFNQWEGEFNTWFEHIQTVLSEEVVTNLYAEIDKRVKIADKATNSEAIAGTSTTKWMTPAATKAAVEGKINAEFNVSGTGSLIIGRGFNLTETFGSNWSSGLDLYGSVLCGPSMDVYVSTISRVPYSNVSVTLNKLGIEGNIIQTVTLSKSISGDSSGTLNGTCHVGIRIGDTDYYFIANDNSGNNTSGMYFLIYMPGSNLSSAKILQYGMSYGHNENYFSVDYTGVTANNARFILGLIDYNRYTMNVYEHDGGIKTIQTGFSSPVKFGVISIPNTNYLVVAHYTGTTITFSKVDATTGGQIAAYTSITVSSTPSRMFFYHYNGAGYAMFIIGSQGHIYKVTSTSVSNYGVITLPYPNINVNITKNYLVFFDTNHISIYSKSSRNIIRQLTEFVYVSLYDYNTDIVAGGVSSFIFLYDINANTFSYLSREPYGNPKMCFSNVYNKIYVGNVKQYFIPGSKGVLGIG